MDKMRMESQDLTQANIEKIAEFFPGVITEAVGEDGKLKKAVNFALLKQVLSDEVIDGDEAYEFTWVGKKASIVEAGKPIRKTLRPVAVDETEPTGLDSEGKPYCSSGSKNWESTENLYIEGDNLDVLKLLQESYLGKVKMIYIDPPYNTGNDFIYRDSFTMDKDDYDEEAGVYDEDGDKLFRNTESNGRFHSDWCSMMYPRLVLARNLLRDDGAIFISIDDGEQANLRKICAEIFGEENFVANIMWQKRYSVANDHKMICPIHDFVMVYRKSDAWERNLWPRTEQNDKQYRYEDELGVFRPDNYKCNKTADERPNLYYPITHPKTGEEIWPSRDAVWRYSQDRHAENVKNNLVFWGKDGTARIPSFKRYRHALRGGGGTVPGSWWTFEFAGHNDEAAKETSELIGNRVFSTPKPIRLVQKTLQLSSDASEPELILDFFSGSGVTAHAVMQLNAEDGGNRKFIMVQLPEECAPESEAAKAGYANICEIGKERIRRAGEKIKIDNAGKEGIENLDTGFRVLKLDSTNMKDVYYGADEYDQHSLGNLISNIKEDRDDMDLLYGCLLEWGLPLSLPHTSEKIDGVTVHTYNNGDLMACFAEKISEAAVREIAKRQPLRVVFRDSSFASAPAKINVEEIFKLMAPNTTVKVI